MVMKMLKCKKKKKNDDVTLEYSILQIGEIMQ